MNITIKLPDLYLDQTGWIKSIIIKTIIIFKCLAYTRFNSNLQEFKSCQFKETVATTKSIACTLVVNCTLLLWNLHDRWYEIKDQTSYSWYLFVRNALISPVVWDLFGSTKNMFLSIICCSLIKGIQFHNINVYSMFGQIHAALKRHLSLTFEWCCVNCTVFNLEGCYKMDAIPLAGSLL